MNKRGAKNIEDKAHSANNEYKGGRRDDFRVEKTLKRLQEDGQPEC
jgi:hypothetical protein